MNDFIDYKNNRLFIEDVAIGAMAASLGTPFYAYSSAAIADAYKRLTDAIHHPRVKIHYAVKANSNIAILKLLHQLGAGMDIVSCGEMKRCLAANIQGQNIVFSGVGKTDDDIAFALQNNIYRFNVESFAELDAISRVAVKLGVLAPVALRINPDVDAKTPSAKTSTGKKDNKFGINWEQVEEAYRLASTLPSLRPVGLTMHIGSQVIRSEPFTHAFARMEKMVGHLRERGYSISQVSLGGGLGIAYQNSDIPPVTAYGNLVRESAERLGCDVELEPGRFLVGEAGILVSKVIYVKEGTAKNFLIIDAAMNDLIRPTLYEAYHPILPVIDQGATRLTTYDVVGPICESGDYLALNRSLPVFSSGDLLVLTHAGAYGAGMASMYNSRSLIQEILVNGQKFDVIRPILTIEQQLSWENIPRWLLEAS